MPHLEFEEFHPLTEFYAIASGFNRFGFYSDEPLPDDAAEILELLDEDEAFSYRGFEVFIEWYDCIYIRHVPGDVGWRCSLPAHKFTTVEDLRSVAEAFINDWHRAKQTPGQLAIPGICA
ncbi:MAG TPA: hypothetical protein V6D12_13760 [Candidatus Obscuribacterales bacterium]